MILGKVKDAFIALLMTCVGFLMLFLGLSKGKERKRVTKQLNDSLSRVDAERMNRLYVKKIRLDKRVAEFNRLHNITPSEDNTDTNDTT